MSTQYGSTGSSAVATSPTHAQYTHIEGISGRVQSVGRYVSLPDNIYHKTNFYIRQSRGYVGNHKLTEFVYFRRLQWIYGVVAVASLFTAFSSLLSFLAFFVNIVFCVIWSQHLYVVVKTMPLVLMQPSLPDSHMSRSNQHLQISVEHHQADILETNDELVGILGTNRVSGKLLVFKHSAVSVMKSCMIISTVLFAVSLSLLSYCSGFGLVQSLKGHAWLNNTSRLSLLHPQLYMFKAAWLCFFVLLSGHLSLLYSHNTRTPCIIWLV